MSDTQKRSQRGTPSEQSRQIGERIRARRRELGWQQVVLAEKLGVGRDSISRYETGQTEIVVSDLARLADILSVQVTYFYAGSAVDYGWGPQKGAKHEAEALRKEQALLAWFRPLSERMQEAVLLQVEALNVMHQRHVRENFRQKHWISEEDDTLANLG